MAIILQFSLNLRISCHFQIIRRGFPRKGAMETKKIFVTRPDVPAIAIKMLKSKYNVELWDGPLPISRENFISKVKGCHGIFTCLTGIDKEVLEAAAPDLQVIGTMSVGYDNIDIEECKKHGVIVGNTPDVLTAAVAELTVGLLLATARRFIEATHDVTNGNWIKVGGWSPMYMCGMQIQGSIVGIFGFGRIGLGIAKRLKGFEVKKILYTGRSPHPKEAAIVDAEYVTFDDLLKNSDIIIISCSLTPETKEVFNKAAFDKMKSSAIIINTSRGAVIQQDDLFEALKSRKIKAAGLDVMSPEPLPHYHPLTTLDNCVLLPHIGSATESTRINMAIMTSQNIIAAFEGQELPSRVC